VCLAEGMLESGHMVPVFLLVLNASHQLHATGKSLH